MALEPQPFVEAIAAIRRQVSVLPETYYGAIPAKNRALAFTVSGLAGLDQIRAVHETLIRAQTENGWSFQRWKEAVSGGEINLGLPNHRLETIYRAAMQGAWSRGRAEQINRNTRTHPYLMYSAVNDSRTRPSHAALHGTILPADDPWWDSHYAPLGFGCRCVCIALTKKEAERRGITTAPPTEGPDPGWSGSGLRDDATDGYRNAIDRRADTPAGQAAAPLLQAMRARLDDPQAFAPTMRDVLGATVYAGLLNRAVQGIPADAGVAMRAYRSDRQASRDVNAIMRHVSTGAPLTVRNPDRYLPMIAGLFEAFRDLPKAPGVVRRNVSKAPDGFTAGAIVSFPGPLSAAAAGGAMVPGAALLVINQRSGVVVDGDVLISPNARFRVTRRETQNGKLTIWLEEIDI